MDTLPNELLGLVLLWDIRHYRCDKNKILELRLVCKTFDAILKPYLFKAIQLEFSRFLKDGSAPGIEALAPVGKLCEALYLDMMVVRDEEEISRLSNVFLGVFPKVPEVAPLLESLHRYSMSANTFDEVDFRHTLENVLDNIPNMKRLKLNLPFQVVGQKSRTATLLLATTLAAINKRPEEHKSLETFVIDHISDTTVIDICNNPIDLINTMKILGVLEHLIMSIKRQEALLPRQALFSHNLWFLIRKAAKLKSLCLVGWNTKRDINTRRHSHGVSLNVWTMRSLPFSSETSFKLEHLRFLELKRVDIDPRGFLDLVREAADSLKEIYLNEVYLKVHGAEDRENTSLWIGHPDIPRPTKCCWLAADLRDIENLHLDILRATALGYDDFKPDAESSHPDYDLKDPSGYDKSFDQRFVEAVFSGMEKSWENPFEELSVLPNTMNLPHQGARIPPAPSLELISGPMDIASLSPDAQNRTLVNAQTATQIGNYDAELYQQRRNTTSKFKTCIDGYFVNHNEQTLKVLQNIITIADKGMTLISAEIDRARHGQEALATAVNEVGGQNNDLTGPEQGAAA